MDIAEAIKERRSIRAFKPDPVSQDILYRIMEQSLWGPSWANTQPWEFAVATGKQLEEIQKGFVESGRTEFSPDVARPYEFPEPYISRIEYLKKKDSKEEKELRDIRNWRHYGAPAVIYLLIGRSFFYQQEGINVWSLYDCGGVVQNIMLLAASQGLGTIAQAQAVVFPDIIRDVLKIPELKLLALGIAIGYPDWEDPANKSRSQRESMSEVVTWHGFE